MPHINRIRVNNVKYNVGTQFYDDLCLRFQGKNSLYDLANGGGKSVLMLLLLQNLIPNCTLDDKQPIEKLFRGNTGSTVIHSLIEWTLDKADREEKGFRFMTTGFCARKKADRVKEGEDEISSSAIEYFNYCIFYNEFQDYDIRNLPLTNGNERISFKGLKELLKGLQSESNRKLKVRLFENSKSEYQRYIAGYGLYESQWNIIRGINKTEGHVRTYFETNYRTSRKVVEDLLIEEIIQKAYNLKTGKEKDTEELAQTLLEIREQLVELSEKKQKIADYDRQTEVIAGFLKKFEPLMQLFELRRDAEEETSVFYHLLLKEEERIRELAENLELELGSMRGKKEDAERKLMTLDLQEVEYAFEKAEREREQSEQEWKLKQESVELLRDAVTRKESVNYYLNYRKAESKARTIEAEIHSLKQGNEGLLLTIEQLTAQKHKKDAEMRLVLEEREKEADANLKAYREDTEAAEEAERKSDNQSAVLASRIAEGEEHLVVLQKEMRRSTREFPLLLREQVSEKTEEIRKKLQEETKERERLCEEKEALREKIQNTKLAEKDIAHALSGVDAKIVTQEAFAEKYQNLTRMLRSRQEIYKEIDVYRLAALLDRKKNEAVIEENEVQKTLKEEKKYLAQLEQGTIFQVSDEVERLRDYICQRYQEGMLGAEVLERAGLGEKQALLEHLPYLPHGIVVSHLTYEKIRQNPKPEEWKCVTRMIPVIDKEMLESGRSIQENGVMFAGQEPEYFLERESLEKELKKTRETVYACEQRINLLDKQRKIYEEDRRLVQEYVDEYLENYSNWEEELLARRKRKEELEEKLSGLKEEEHAAEVRLRELEGGIPKAEARIENAQKQMKEIQKLAEVFKAYDEAEARQKTLCAEKEQIFEEQQRLQRQLAEEKDRTAQEKERLELIRRQLSDMKEGWKRYELYYKEEIVPEETVCDNLEEELDGAIAAFEYENQDVSDKNEMLNVLKEQAEAALRELKKRKADMDGLELLYTDNHLTEVLEERLEEMREGLEKEENACKVCEEKTRKLGQVSVRYQSQAELMERQLVERFHDVQRVQTTEAEIGELKEQLQGVKVQYQKEYIRLIEEQKHAGKSMEENQAMLERIRWIAEEYQIQDMETEEKAGFTVLDFKETERSIRKNWNRLREKKESSKTLFQKAKTDCEEELKTLGAGSFAMQMKSQIQIPETMEEAKKIVKNLEEACVMIRMGREQIESGLQDIEKIKSSFENQCLQRCNSIRVELDKFPKLSSIMIDEKLTQIVKLKIPYVKEEQQQMCIETYLSQVIDNLGRYETEQEKKRYLIQELSMKRLFSAIVTDMNRISLELYKRERVKEQSRHLKYEEAVGSTGQSQGIYIQFLIAVINYIASINSYHTGRESLKKVIFIDNPFGAAKDTYIWEPIFAMLAANRVQLIVPTRGATPAIIGRFDVNYILGQKMVGTKQQTVVVDYRSKIETEETEYVKMEYEQTSLF